jgi:hypothetical protein
MPFHSDEAEIQGLIEVLRASQSQVRRGAARVLGAVRPPSNEVMAALVAALKDRDAFVRLEVAHALKRMGSEVVPLLVEAWKDTDAEYRNALASTLGMLGPQAAAAVPLLTEALEDQALHRSAAAALALIQGGSRIAWDRLLERLGPWVLATVGVLLVANEVLSWLSVFSQAQSVALRVAVGWGILGAGLGALVGASLHGRLGATLGVKALGLSGAYVGLLVGGAAGAVIEPILVSLANR